MPDPSWSSVGTGTAKYGQRVRLLYAETELPEGDAEALALWAIARPYRAAYVVELIELSHVLALRMLYLWSRELIEPAHEDDLGDDVPDRYETFSAWRKRPASDLAEPYRAWRENADRLRAVALGRIEPQQVLA